MARLIGITLVIALIAAGAAVAEPVTGKAARKALLSTKGAEVEIMAVAGLPQDQSKVLEMVAGDQPYYGAIAISPDEGLMSEATFAAANYHDTASASAAALMECNAKKTGESDCVVAALIRPKNWKDTGFQLSRAATVGFKDDYDMEGGALAISMSTGLFGIANGEGAGPAAVAACAAKSEKANDCRIAVAN